MTDTDVTPPPATPGSRAKALFIALAGGVAGLAVAAGLAFLFKDQLLGKDIPLAETAPAPAVAEPPSEAPAPAGRPAIVLRDDVKGYLTAFDRASTIAARYRTGDQVRVVATETKASGDWYRIEGGGKAAWVDGRDAFVFEDNSTFDVFLTSTQSIKDLFNAETMSEGEKQKLQELESEAYLLRTVHHPDTAVAEPALRKLLSLSLAQDRLVTTWFALAKDKTVKSLDALNMELSVILGEGRAASSAARFEQEFPALPDETRIRILKDTCSAVMSERELFRAAVATAGKDGKTPVFDELLTCIASGFAADGASYDWSAPGAEILRGDGVLEGILPKERLAKLTGKVPLDKIRRQPSAQERAEPEPGTEANPDAP